MPRVLKRCWAGPDAFVTWHDPDQEPYFVTIDESLAGRAPAAAANDIAGELRRQLQFAPCWRACSASTRMSAQGEGATASDGSPRTREAAE